MVRCSFIRLRLSLCYATRIDLHTVRAAELGTILLHRFVRLPPPEQVSSGALQATLDSLMEQVKLLNTSAAVKRVRGRGACAVSITNPLHSSLCPCRASAHRVQLYSLHLVFQLEHLCCFPAALASCPCAELAVHSRPVACPTRSCLKTLPLAK